VLSIAALLIAMNAYCWKRIYGKFTVCTGKWVCLALQMLGTVLGFKQTGALGSVYSQAISYYSENETV